MIDTHAHLFLSSMAPLDYIEAAQAAGVTGIINVATDIKSALQCIEVASANSHVYATVGVHPCESGEINPTESVRRVAKEYPVVAIGEIGLDGYRSAIPMADQIIRFRSQLILARELNLPAIIHCREAAETMLSVMVEFHDIRKVYHCFSESQEFMRAIDDDNTMFSFTGNITYENALYSREAVLRLPIEKIMLETDSPYLTPRSKKGRPNHSAFISDVAIEVARIKEMNVDDVVSATVANSRRFFKL